MTDIQHNPAIEETHPWDPYIPDNARVLIMGSFPPQPKRWSMDFYYPNRANHFWYMMGLIFMGDRYALCNADQRTFNLDAIRKLLDSKGIALHDTCHVIRRLDGNASDENLEIVEPTDFGALLARMPECSTMVTTGTKAASVLAKATSSKIPAMGAEVVVDSPFPASRSPLHIWRMPSTSQRCRLTIDEKAAHYRRLLASVGIL